MSREEAHRRTGARRRGTPKRTVTAPRTPEAAVPPQPPLFTARTDGAAGVVRTRGHLDGVSAEVLCRILTALRRAGHREIAVRLGTTTTADDDAREILAVHARRLGGEGVRVHVG